MYICKPERNMFQVKLLLILSLSSTLSLFFISSVTEGRVSSICQLLGFGALIFAILANVRFSLTEFEYAIDDNDFTITKILGNKRQIMCCVALESAIEIMSKRDYEHLPSSEKGIIKYSLNQNMKADSYVFLFDFNGKRAKIEFEPNEVFVAIIKNKIDTVSNKKD